MYIRFFMAIAMCVGISLPINADRPGLLLRFPGQQSGVQGYASIIDVFLHPDRAALIAAGAYLIRYAVTRARR